MKALIINGSPRKDGNTSIATAELASALQEEGIEVEEVQVGQLNVSGCLACGYCHKAGKCVKNDIVNELAVKFEQADALFLASPVYFGSANATLVAVADRLFYSTHFDKTMKVGASIAIARRGGSSSTFDELNKYFTISGMPVVSSYYWNMVYGCQKGEAKEDKEGLQTMRMLGKNAAFLMKSIALGKEKYGLPKAEDRVATNFIR